MVGDLTQIIELQIKQLEAQQRQSDEQQQQLEEQRNMLLGMQQKIEGLTDGALPSKAIAREKYEVEQSETIERSNNHAQQDRPVSDV